MPKKTKKEKLRAELRRNSTLVISSHTGNTPVSKMANIEKGGERHTFTFTNTSVKPTIVPRVPYISANYAFVYKDLFKIAVFSLLAIFIQFVLVLLLRTK